MNWISVYPRLGVLISDLNNKSTKEENQPERDVTPKNKIEPVIFGEEVESVKKMATFLREMAALVRQNNADALAQRLALSSSDTSKRQFVDS